MTAVLSQDIPESENRSLVDSSINPTSTVGLRRRCSWKPTSQRLLEAAEERIFKYITVPYEGKYVPLDGGEKVWTVKFNPQGKKVPLVMVHGFGGGIALWAMSIDALAKKRPVYVFDVLGFGRSSRPKFSTDALQAEEEFVASIEQWRRQVGLENFVLLGHSFGGYLASAYTLRHPSRVKHLVLVDPWGFKEKPEELEFNIPLWVRALAAVMSPFNPLAGLRAAGPWGPSLVQKFRPDFQGRFSRLLPDDAVFNYIYHCNAQKPSGENAFKNMSAMLGWAKFPMIDRIAHVDKNIPMTMIHGQESWISHEPSYQTKYLRSNSYVKIEVISDAGHHVYADQPDDFNFVVDRICQKEDKKLVRLLSETSV